jgi:hypothetical protein
MQYEYIHRIFVNGINTRIVVMARLKSSLCMYASKNMPRSIVLKHVTTVIMYAEYIVDISFIWIGIPAILKIEIIGLKRLSDSPFSFFSFLFMCKQYTTIRNNRQFKYYSMLWKVNVCLVFVTVRLLSTSVTVGAL